MQCNKFFKTLIVLADTKAKVFLSRSDIELMAILRRGERFDAVTAVDEEDGFVIFHEAHSGLLIIAPEDRVMVLSNRFSGRS